MKKIIYGIVMMCLLSFHVEVTSAKAASFPDVTTNAKEIEYLFKQEVITGFPDGTFGPKQSVTRLQAVRMLLKAQGITDMTAPDPGLTDMKPDSHGYDIVSKAVQLGIISGKKNKDGTSYFDPSGHLTRAQMAKIIVESQKLPIHSKHSFIDVPKTSSYYNYISTLASTRVTEGYEDGSYRPNIKVSREHFSVFLARMLDDSFKPAKPSFMNDRTKTYLWKYYDEGDIFETQAVFMEMRTIQGQQWQLWKESSVGGEDSYFVITEDEDGLYEDICFDIGGLDCDTVTKESFVAMQYPLIVEKKWDISVFEDEMISGKIKARNQTVRIPAGTFTGVVVVEDAKGWTYYYAPNVGLIKTMENGILFSELTSISK